MPFLCYADTYLQDAITSALLLLQYGQSFWVVARGNDAIRHLEQRLGGGWGGHIMSQADNNIHKEKDSMCDLIG